jgi:hypothetical protein
MPELHDVLKEGAYAAIGLSVLGFQKAQVHRRELVEQLKAQRPSLDSQLERAERQLSDFARIVEDRIRAVVGLV